MNRTEKLQKEEIEKGLSRLIALGLLRNVNGGFMDTHFSKRLDKMTPRQALIIGVEKGEKLGRTDREAEILKLIDEVLLGRRMQINRLRSEEMVAHLHTFINHFEDELKSKIKGGAE